MSMIRVFVLLLVFIVPALYYVVSKTEVKLIPLNILLGNPSKVKVTVSPNGKFLAYLAPQDGILNVFVKSINQNDDKAITSDTKRGISDYFWTADSQKILYLRDNGGDENWNLYKVDLEKKTEENLTPFAGVKTRIIKYDIQYPTKIIIGLNKRDKKVFDVYELDLENNELKLIQESFENVLDWGIDRFLNIKWALKSIENGAHQLLLKDNNEFKEFMTWSFDDGAPDLIRLSADDEDFFILDSKNSNTSRLRKVNIKTKESTDIYADPKYDINGVEFDINTKEPIAVNVYSSKSIWKVLDNRFEDDFKNIQTLDAGEFALSRSKNKEDLFWVVSFTRDNAPVSYWLYYRKTKKGKFLYYTRPELLNYKLAKMYPISFVTRDNIPLEGYITYPVNSKKKNLPLVLNVHGGPWQRDFWGFNPTVQWMANRGYAVLTVNYRGSTGYGKKFKDLGNKQWGRNMQNDLTDAVNWAISEKIADPKKVAIYGASYGGYAALCGAAFTPDLYCCAVDMVGISNLLTLIKTIPPYWSVFLEDIYKRIGNPSTQEEFLKSISPLFSAKNIKIPLLIAQGANDPRVKQSESDQIVQALKENNIEHTYLLFPDEGHGFYKAENRLKFFKEAEKFLAKYLGGKTE